MKKLIALMFVLMFLLVPFTSAQTNDAALEDTAFIEYIWSQIVYKTTLKFNLEGNNVFYNPEKKAWTNKLTQKSLEDIVGFTIELETIRKELVGNYSDQKDGINIILNEIERIGPDAIFALGDFWLIFKNKSMSSGVRDNFINVARKLKDDKLENFLLKAERSDNLETFISSYNKSKEKEEDKGEENKEETKSEKDGLCIDTNNCYITPRSISEANKTKIRTYLSKFKAEDLSDAEKRQISFCAYVDTVPNFEYLYHVLGKGDYTGPIWPDGTEYVLEGKSYLGDFDGFASAYVNALAYPYHRVFKIYYDEGTADWWIEFAEEGFSGDITSYSTKNKFFKEVLADKDEKLDVYFEQDKDWHIAIGNYCNLSFQNNLDFYSSSVYNCPHGFWDLVHCKEIEFNNTEKKYYIFAKEEVENNHEVIGSEEKIREDFGPWRVYKKEFLDSFLNNKTRIKFTEIKK